MTTTYTKFDKATLETLRKELDDVLKKFGDEHGLVIKQHGGRFQESKLDLKVEVKILNGAPTFEDTILNQMVVENGLVMINKVGEKLVEYKPKNHKYPFIYEGANGTRYKAPLDHIRTIFAA